MAEASTALYDDCSASIYGHTFEGHLFHEEDNA